MPEIERERRRVALETCECVDDAAQKTEVQRGLCRSLVSSAGAGGWPVLEVNSARPGGFNARCPVAPAGGFLAGRSVARSLRSGSANCPVVLRDSCGGRRDTTLDAETGVSRFDATDFICRYHIDPVFGKVVVTI
jgi:hypothetical protein